TQRRARRDLLTRWEAAARNLVVAERSASLATDHVIKMRSLYTAGASSLLELLDARHVLDDALDRLSEARAQSRAARFEAEARRTLALARRDLVRLPVLAKHGGIVVRRSVEPGGPIVDGGEIAAIVPRDLIVFEARVAATDRARLGSGQAAVVATTGFPAIAAS